MTWIVVNPLCRVSILQLGTACPASLPTKWQEKRRCFGTMLHVHPVIYPFFSVARTVFFMFLFLTDASVQSCLHKPILCCNSCMDVQKNNEIYRNKLQSDLLSLSEYLAAAYCNTGTNSAASGRIVMDFVQTWWWILMTLTFIITLITLVIT